LKIELRPIGIVHSPYKDKGDVPCCQKDRLEGIGEIEIYEEYADGLKDVEGFSHLIIVFIFHRSEGYSLHVKPYLDNKLRGVFVTRHPNRPNPLGLCIVELIERKGNRLRIKGLDMLDGTPIVDIKPYTHYDAKKNIKRHWRRLTRAEGMLWLRRL
jgi:tRNA-Thr(GGU) m(6)t(6)A37 methyltransferase TsaA